VLSGYTELQSITDAVNEGDIYKFFTKPWDDELLRSHVAEAFRRKGLSDENQRLATEVRRANLELAESNQRQQDMLARQRDRLGLQESRAAHAQELLERLPAPLIGLDPDGTIVFVNAEARSLIGGGQALIGLPARRMLPADWGLDDSVRRQPRRVVVGGRRFVLSRAAMGDATASNGEMLALAPDVDA
jgi:PAS domain-containing protein